MWLTHFIFINISKWFELLLQFVVFFNFFQIIRQQNFYIMLSYFFCFVLYMGILFIFFNCDIASIIIWIIYGGVIIIFFIYSIMWFEPSRYTWNNMTTLSFNTIFVIFCFCFCFCFCSLDVNFLLHLYFYNVTLIEKESDLALNYTRELQLLGDGLLFNTSVLFIMSSYFLFFGCIVVVLIILVARRMTSLNSINTSILSEYQYRSTIFIQKAQSQIIQNSEELYQTYSFQKYFRITTKIHKILKLHLIKI